MDDGDRNPYVARAMNLLLLLSALLSALTGVGVGVRRPEVVQSVAAQSVAVRSVRMTVATIARRPVVALPTLAATARPGVAAVPLLIGAADLWANRRRE